MITPEEKKFGVLVIRRDRRGGFVVDVKLGDFIQFPSLAAFESYPELMKFLAEFYRQES